MASILCAWRSCSSRRLRSLMSTAMASRCGSPLTSIGTTDMSTSCVAPALSTERISTSRGPAGIARRLEHAVAILGVLPEPELGAGASDDLLARVAGELGEALVQVDELAVGGARDADGGRIGVKDAREALLGAAQRLLGAAALGEIARDDRDRRRALVAHRDAARLGPAVGAVGADEADRPRLARLAVVTILSMRPRMASRSSGWTKSSTGRPTSAVARFVAEERDERGVGVGHRAVGQWAVREDAVGGALDELLIVGERAAVRLGDAHLLGDVAADREAHVPGGGGEPLQDSLRDELRAVLAAVPRVVEHGGSGRLVTAASNCRHELRRPDVAQGHAAGTPRATSRTGAPLRR